MQPNFSMVHPPQLYILIFILKLHKVVEENLNLKDNSWIDIAIRRKYAVN